MKFTEFLSENLARRRGFQTELADHLEVAKSTITAWRQGATPDFASCLKLADYFRLDPMDIFEMLEDSNYISVYMRFFVTHPSVAKGDGPVQQADPSRLTEEDLYPESSHARLHRDLQTLLKAATAESRAIATVIRMAARQLRADRKRRSDRRPLKTRVASVYRTLRVEGAEQVRDGLGTKQLPASNDLRAQES